LNDLAASITANASETNTPTQIVRAALNNLAQKKMSEQQQSEEARKAAEAAKKEQESVWTPEELSALAKAIIRFPGGAVNRWENIAHYMNHSKSVKEIIAKVKSIKSDVKDGPANKPDLADSFSRWQKSKSKLTGADQDGPSVRYDAFEVENESASASASTTSSPSSSTASTPASSAPSSSAPSPAASPAPAKKPAAATPTASPKAGTAKTPVAASPASTPTSSASASPASEFPPEIVNWSPEEQKALEAAIKKYPNNHPDRWYVYCLRAAFCVKAALLTRRHLQGCHCKRSAGTIEKRLHSAVQVFG
jgi:hypothetical protein